MESLEMKVYQQLCVGCEYERRCHVQCETCDEFKKALKEAALEEVKKEWEDDGWKITNTGGFTDFIKLNPRTNLYDTIQFHHLKKILSISFFSDENINIEVLQRITKTVIALKALGWEVEDE